MIVRCVVRCLHCGSDRLEARAENLAVEAISRATAVCEECGRPWRLSLTMVKERSTT